MFKLDLSVMVLVSEESMLDLTGTEILLTPLSGRFCSFEASLFLILVLLYLSTSSYFLPIGKFFGLAL